MKALSFTGSGAQYFKIWIVNIFFTIITLGLYYPWAKVRNNRYFYGNSELEGRNFEYHATGKQLFFGFLIAMSVLILYTVIETISPAGSVFVLLAFFLALPWIVWRSLMFNMRMTSFSNVRFGFDAALSQAYVNYLLIPIGLMLVVYGVPIALAVFGAPIIKDLIGATSDGSMSPEMILASVIFGIMFLCLVIFAFSYLKKRNTNYALNGIRYGQGVFSTEVRAKPFAVILLKTIGLAVLLIVLLMIMLAVVSMILGLDNKFLEIAANMDDHDLVGQLFDGAIAGTIGVLYFGFIMIGMIVFSYSYSKQRKYIFDNTTLDKTILFSSTLNATPLAWVSISNFVVVILTLGLAIPWAKVRMTRLILENSLVDTQLGFDQYVTQQQEQQSALGEQLGDAFDVDLGIGI